MNRMSLILATVLLPNLLFAQKDKDIPAFGKIQKSDLEMKECDFDKTAEAVVLFDFAEVYCNFYPNSYLEPVNTEIERHVRIKILKDKGLDKANIRIPYYNYKNIEDIKNISAQTYNLNESGEIITTRVEKKLMYDKKINKRYSERIFTFPDVKAGSIIEYKYTVAGSGFSGLKDWFFQRSIPVKFSKYIIDFPEEFEVSSQPLCSLPVDVQQKKTGQRDKKSFIMKDVPALRDEPFISCENDYLQRVESSIIAVNTPQRRYNLVRFWPGIIKDLMEDEDFGQQLKRDIPRTADLDEELKPIKDPFQKMLIIHRYVRKNMEWNGYTSIWALDGVKSAWKEKKGTSGEINLILVNLLKDAGLVAHPLLVSTRENGRVSTAMANVSQFDKVMAHVKIGDKIYILDGTEKTTPSSLIPLEVMYSEGLKITKLDTYDWGWETLWNEKQIFKNVVVSQAFIDEQGKITGETHVSSYDYSRLERLSKFKEGKEKFIEHYYTSQNVDIKIDTFELQNIENDTLPLIQKIKFTKPSNGSGDYRYFSTNLFSGLEKNPFVADSRFSDVFFGANQLYNIMAYYTLPDGYTLEELLKNIRMMLPDTSIVVTRLAASDGKRLSTRITLEFRRPFYSAEEYPDFKEFYKKLFAILSEQFVLRKNAKP